MGRLRKYKQWQDVPKHIQEAYKEDRWRVVIPKILDFKIKSIDWAQVDWVNYICVKGYFTNKQGRKIKI